MVRFICFAKINFEGHIKVSDLSKMLQITSAKFELLLRRSKSIIYKGIATT